MTPGSGLFQIEDCVDEAGAVTLPPGATLIALIDGNIAHLPDMVAYRYLDYSGSEPRTFEVTWSEPVSYTHLTLPTMSLVCRYRWWPCN